MAKHTNKSPYYISGQLTFNIVLTPQTVKHMTYGLLAYALYNKRAKPMLSTTQRKDLMELYIEHEDLFTATVAALPTETVNEVLNYLVGNEPLTSVTACMYLQNFLEGGDVGTFNDSQRQVALNFVLLVLRNTEAKLEEARAQNKDEDERRQQQRAEEFVKVLRKQGYTVTAPAGTKAPAAKRRIVASATKTRA
jgi:hypothetical protein